MLIREAVKLDPLAVARANELAEIGERFGKAAGWLYLRHVTPDEAYAVMLAEVGKAYASLKGKAQSEMVEETAKRSRLIRGPTLSRDRVL